MNSTDASRSGEDPPRPRRLIRTADPLTEAEAERIRQRFLSVQPRWPQQPSDVSPLVAAQLAHFSLLTADPPKPRRLPWLLRHAGAIGIAGSIATLALVAWVWLHLD